MPIGRAVPNDSPMPRRAARRRALVAAVVLAALLASLTPGAAAQAPETTDPGPLDRTEEQEQILLDTLALAPEDAPAAPDDVFAAVIEAEAVASEAMLARFEASAAANRAREAALTAAVALDASRSRVADAVAVRQAAETELAYERKRLSDLTVRAYVTNGDISSEEMRAYVDGDTSDRTEGRTVIFAQVLEGQQQVVDGAVADLAAATKRLAAAQERQAEATTTSETRYATARQRSQVEDQAKANHEQATQALDTANVRLRSGSSGAPVPQEVAIIGMPRLSAGDLATWFAESPYVSRVSTPIEDYARWFIEEGAAEGIRGDIAFAQAVLETGGFANTDSVMANNFSGIGHCDSCASGWTFPSPQMGVRAQIQLLKSYAVRRPEYVNDLVDRRLRGPAGCCVTWGDLTTVWATDPGYGPKVMLLYSDMVDHALRRRANGQGFDEPVFTAPVGP